MCDLCRDAALVDVEAAPELGASVTLYLTLPGTGDGEIALSGKVIRVVQEAGKRHGAAILFSEVPSSAAARIEFFLAFQAGQER